VILYRHELAVCLRAQPDVLANEWALAQRPEHLATLDGKFDGSTHVA
jgi:hypothetical protein